MGLTPAPSTARLRRLAEELTEVGLAVDGAGHGLLLQEVDLACARPSTNGGWPAPAASSSGVRPNSTPDAAG